MDREIESALLLSEGLGFLKIRAECVIAVHGRHIQREFPIIQF